MRWSLSAGYVPASLFAGVYMLMAGNAIAQSNADLARGALTVLKNRCFTCHGQNGIANKNIFVLDRSRLLKDKTVVPNDANSSLLRQVERGTMPLNSKTFEPERLPEAEIATLKKWIQGGAPDWTNELSNASPRNFLAEGNYSAQNDAICRQNPRFRAHI